ncbi:hypothetical protein BDR07DRAFT_142245 [Suillus spraguei]|nr:hypothetical protein BDR07DRAFT_142245 [Suillus spraguei]
MPDHEPGPVQSQLRRRRRDDPDTSPRVNFQGELHRKRQRVASPVTPSRPRTSALEKGRRAIGYKSSSRISNENDERSSEERNRRFARGVLDGAISFDNDQMPQFDVLPVPRSPEHDAPAAQSDDEPMATQQTLVNSPNARSSPSGRATAVVVRAASMSSQAISITQRAARRPPSRHRRAQRDQSPVAEVRTSAAGNPQVKRTRMSGRHQPAVTASDAPYRHTRARSQSVDLPPQPASASKRRRVVSAKGKMKELELEEVPEEDAERKGEPSNQGPQISNHRPEAETFQEQQDVADYLLKGGSLFGDDEQSDEPTHGQEFTVDSSSEDPSDSDDVATHKNLQHSGQRLNRMAAAGFRTRLRSNTSVSASNKMATRSPVI